MLPLTIFAFMLSYSTLHVRSFGIPKNYQHPDEFHPNMTVEQRMVATGRVLIDSSLNHTEKLDKIVKLTAKCEEPQSRSLLEKLVLLKKWLDDRLALADEAMRSIHEKKFKLLFVVKGSPDYLHLTRKANKLKSSLTDEQRKVEEAIEKEFHEKASELGIHETIQLIAQPN